jgi:NAD(P)-dependent dehydrogenase (short-subunit alcohol dehydrogenase family)
MATATGPQLRFDGKVVIISGAGRGLGREYALLLAARGAKVVVNDFGVAISDTDGSGVPPATNPADEVVAEIVAAGGVAVANHDTVATVEGGAAIVAAAVDAFGTVDVVVNNAGQVRMQPFGEFADEHVATVIATQLLGTLNVSRPAWRHMAERGGGRFVNVSSGAAYGGFTGSSVYSMAKAGVIGLTVAMAAEGAEVGIAANVVAPYAKTRPGTGFGPIPWSEDLAAWLHPSKVAPVVAWLAHDSCAVSGECFAAGAGHVARVAFAVNDGFTDRDLTPESVAAHAPQLAASATSPAGGPTSPLMPNMMGGFGR